jgi:hypothetical protein
MQVLHRSRELPGYRVIPSPETSDNICSTLISRISKPMQPMSSPSVYFAPLSASYQHIPCVRAVDMEFWQQARYLAFVVKVVCDSRKDARVNGVQGARIMEHR